MRDGDRGGARRVVAIVRICLTLLALGFVVNVFVAWFGGALTGTSYSSTGTPSEEERRWWNANRPPGYRTDPQFKMEWGGIGWAASVFREHVVAPGDSVRQLAWGFPARSMEGFYWYSAHGGPTRFDGWYRSDFLQYNFGNWQLPVRMVPVATAINTVSWGALIGAPWIVWMWLRARRRRHGICPKCGYHVGTSARCSECGVIIAEVARPSARWWRACKQVASWSLCAGSLVSAGLLVLLLIWCAGWDERETEREIAHALAEARAVIPMRADDYTLIDASRSDGPELTYVWRREAVDGSADSATTDALAQSELSRFRDGIIQSDMCRNLLWSAVVIHVRIVNPAGELIGEVSVGPGTWDSAEVDVEEYMRRHGMTLPNTTPSTESSPESGGAR